MRFLLDENIGKGVAVLLTLQGFSAKRIRKVQPGIEDSKVLSLALKENSILITLDKDFGELIFKRGKSHKGIIYLRLEDQTVENTKRALVWLLSKHATKLENSFVTLTEKQGRYKVRFSSS